MLLTWFTLFIHNMPLNSSLSDIKKGTLRLSGILTPDTTLAFYLNMIPLMQSMVVQFSRALNSTICPRSSDPFCIVTYYIKWVTTSWTHSTIAATPVQALHFQQ